MNPIASKIAPGISSWKKIADVKTINEQGLQIPRIVLGDFPNAILICTGLHLEETSGPLTFLDPENISELIKFATEKKLTLIVYPLINNFGLDYDTNSEEKFLRRNLEGINYNDGWGLTKKPKEVEIAEVDMDEIIKKYKVKLCMSLHEDSVCPGKGYLWINSIRSKDVRQKIYAEVKKNIEPKYLLTMTEQKGEGGVIEDSISIVDSEDDGAFEEWMADKEIPVVLSEAPFGESFEVRKNFHLEVIYASIKAVIS